MLIVLIKWLLIILLIVLYISNTYKEGYVNICRTKMADTSRLECDDNEFLSKIEQIRDGTGKKQYQYTCCTDESKLMQGPTGPIGSTGIPGIAGRNGTPGIVGSIGPAGPIGPEGDRGEQGVKGLTGPVGDKGAMGREGARGNTGTKGNIISSGETSGPPITGKKGRTGKKGPAGPTGPKGNDAPVPPTPISFASSLTMPVPPAPAPTCTVAPVAPTCTAAPVCAAPIKKNRRTDDKKLKEIQIELIKALAARKPPVAQRVVIHNDLEDDNEIEVDYDVDEVVTPSRVQGSEYMHSTYKEPLHY